MFSSLFHSTWYGHFKINGTSYKAKLVNLKTEKGTNYSFSSPLFYISAFSEIQAPNKVCLQKHDEICFQVQQLDSDQFAHFRYNNYEVEITQRGTSEITALIFERNTKNIFTVELKSILPNLSNPIYSILFNVLVGCVWSFFVLLVMQKFVIKK